MNSGCGVASEGSPANEFLSDCELLTWDQTNRENGEAHLLPGVMLREK